MSTRTRPWPTGVPSWADLSSPDPQVSADFYRAVLGWDVAGGDPAFGGYRTCTVRGHAVAGINPGTPARWMLHVATDDAEETCRKVSAAGGTVVSAPMDVGDLGRLAVVADPTGAPVGLWQAAGFVGAELVNEPGGLVWNDLRSTDPALSREFYTAVFGWGFEHLFEDYGTVSNPDAPWPVGGLGPLWGAAPGWLVYFAVPDCDAAAEAVRAAGGAVAQPPKDTPYGRMAQVSDPHGAPFVVMTGDWEKQPDRS